MILQGSHLEQEIDNELPEGFSAYPLRLEEAEALVDMFNQYGLTHLGHHTDTLEDDLVYWQTPGFNPASDALVMRAPQGQPVGYAEFWDIAEPHAHFNTCGVVHPDFENHGIGVFLLDWLTRRAEQALPNAPQGARVSMWQNVESRETQAIAFLEGHGFVCKRKYFHMHIELDQPPAAPVIPTGYQIRAYRDEDERMEMMRVLWDAFHDHWGFLEEPFEDYYRRWTLWAENLKETDPALWFVAVKDGRIVGSCMCSNARPEDPEMGWVNQLGVLRESRKQGVGLALLRHAFGEFHRRGKPRAGLGVDAGSLTGAVRLYESAGMYAARIFNSFEKILRDGTELSVQSLED